MALKYLSVMLVLVPLAASLPALTLEDLEIEDDMRAVGSYVREVRAAAGPDDYHRTYESDGEGDIGYSRKKTGGGKKGYQQFDSFHKKGGDNYEFEKQDSYGLEDEDGKKGHDNQHHEKAARYTKPKKESEDVVEEFNSEEHRENDHEKLVANAADGNGGTEAHGHERADYTLPEKYSYGSGEEYNF